MVYWIESSSDLKTITRCRNRENYLIFGLLSQEKLPTEAMEYR
jgi:hypothetical protein